MPNSSGRNRENGKTNWPARYASPLVAGRGSSDPDANGDVCKLARILGEGMGYGWSAACFIGVTTPLLTEALDRCRRLGFGRILVLPFFLFTGVLEKRIRHQTQEFAEQLIPRWSSSVPATWTPIPCCWKSSRNAPTRPSTAVRT